MTYALTHEKELLDQSYRPRMGVSQTPRPTSQQPRTTESSHHPRDSRCGLLRVEKRLSLAVVAPRLPTLGDCLLLVQEVAYRWDMGEAERRAARALADLLRQAPAA